MRTVRHGTAGRCNILTASFCCIKRRFSARLTALNRASIAAIIRLMIAHVAVTMRSTKNQMVNCDITRWVCIMTWRNTNQK